MRAGVLVLGIRFHAQQVVSGELGFDPLEEVRAGTGDGEQRPARGAGEQVQPFRACLAIAERIDRHACVRDIEHLVVELQGVDSRSRFGGHPS